LQVYITTGYNHVTFRDITLNLDSLVSPLERHMLLTSHDLRKKAVSRFLREETRVVSLGVYNSLVYEVDKKKLKKLESLLKVDIRTKAIKETLRGYINGRLSLDETYDQYLPLLIASKLVETIFWRI